MTEIPKSTQFVGSADARGALAREAAPKDEFTLNAEQQKVADVMKESGERLQSEVSAAREQAGEKLKKVRGTKGKELFNAGWKQYKVGFEEATRQEIGYGLQGAMIGGVAGAVGGALDRNPGRAFSGALQGAKNFGVFGAVLGWESSFKPYNERAAAENLPPAKWYDWALSMIGGLSLYSIKNPTGNWLITGGKLVAATLINPAGVAAFRNMGTGLSMMALGK